MERPDVIVIGGGLHGCSAALALALRGASVLVLEKDGVGRHASGANAGGVRQIGRALPEIPLSVASMELWHRIGELVDDDCGFVSTGHLFIAETETELARLKQRQATVSALGYDHEELIDSASLRDMVPAVAPHCVGAIVSRRDGSALPYQTVQAFSRKAQRLGAKLREGVRVRTVRRDGKLWHVTLASGEVLEAPVVVNTAGAWAADIAAQAGEPVPLRAVAPMLMITERLAPFISPVVSAAVRPLSFKQLANGTVLIGGGYEGLAIPDTNGTTVDFAGLAENVRTVVSLFPNMADVRIVRSWAAIEGRMQDDIPVIGPSSTSTGLFHAFGFSAHGFQLGPIVGSIIADLITRGRTDLPIAPFSIDRFSASASRTRGSHAAADA